MERRESEERARPSDDASRSTNRPAAPGELSLTISDSSGAVRYLVRGDVSTIFIRDDLNREVVRLAISTTPNLLGSVWITPTAPSENWAAYIREGSSWNSISTTPGIRAPLSKPCASIVL